MKKIQLMLALTAAALFVSCGSGPTGLVFNNYVKNANAQGPDGVPACLELTLPIPAGEGDGQTNVINAVKELISRSRIAEELGAPEGETLEAIADNYHQKFMDGMKEDGMAGPIVYHLQITCPYSNSQCAVLHVSDGVYGNGGPTEYVWNVRLTDGKLMTFREIATMDGYALIQLAEKYATAEDYEDISLNMESFWLWPAGDSCMVKAQTGTHFYHDFPVPMESVASYLTDEGKKLFGVATEAEDSKEEATPTASESGFFSSVLNNYRELYLKGMNGRQIAREIQQTINEAKQNQLPVVGSPYGISCTKAVIDDYNVQDNCINIIMELVPDEGTDFHLQGYKGIGYSTDYGPYGKFVQAQAYSGKQLIFARTCHCHKGKMLVTLIIRYDDLQQWKTCDHIKLVEKKK